LDLYRRRLGLGPVRLNEQARQALASADWPGNVRELDHLLGRAVLRASAGIARDAPILIGPEQLQLELPAGSAKDPLHPSPLARENSGAAPRPKTMREAVEETKRSMVLRAVAEHDGNWAAAARSLGMARGNLHHMAQRLGLRR